MPNFLIWSDLHCEHHGFDIPNLQSFSDTFDAVLMAGDTDTGRSLCHVGFAEKVSRAYGVPVIMVMGNHEYYGQEMNDLHQRQRQKIQQINADGAQVHILSGDAIEIEGVRIIGTTLWTDFDLDPAMGLKARQRAQAMMNDYRMIYIDDGSGKRRLTASDTEAFHKDQKQELLDLISVPFEGKTVVMTHHMPIRQAVHAKYLHDPINAAFASDMLRDIKDLNFDVWLYGHSHENYEIEVMSGNREKRFVSNPRGYPHEKTRFDPLRLISV